MPIEFSCTKCPAKFRVPDVMAGKKVRCPKCQAIERVPGGDRTPGKADDFWKQKKPGHSSINSLDGLLSGGEYTLKEVSDPGPNQQRSGSGRISIHEARDAVSRPGTVLLILSILVTALNAIGTVLYVLLICFAPPAWLNGPTALFYMVMFGVLTCLSCASLKGVNSFRNVNESGWAWTGLVLAMTPFGTSGCCVIALPFAIWGILLLSDRRIGEHYN